MPTPRSRAVAPVWLFDLDNTLHDAGCAAFAQITESMTVYMERELALTRAEAEHLRGRYWQRYGATLLGLVRHHGVKAAHFLHDTHALPGLEARLRSHPHDLAALVVAVGIGGDVLAQAQMHLLEGGHGVGQRLDARGVHGAHRLDDPASDDDGLGFAVNVEQGVHRGREAGVGGVHRSPRAHRSTHSG